MPKPSSPGISMEKRIYMLILALLVQPLQAEDGWLDLTGNKKSVEAFEGWSGGWTLAKEVALAPDNPRLLLFKVSGGAILVNGPTGRERSLLTREKYGDLEVKFDFLISKGSNSGVKLQGAYEIQIFDSYGLKESELTGAHCGGIYPRAEDKPRYHHIDKGTPPKVNACRAPGEWQSLYIVFQAPRFDADGKKTSNAKFVKVVLNDQIIHENVEVLYATGSAWKNKKEAPVGPLMLQGDHGPVAFRNLRIKPLGK
jgi:hypothetical protein